MIGKIFGWRSEIVFEIFYGWCLEDIKFMVLLSWVVVMIVLEDEVFCGVMLNVYGRLDLKIEFFFFFCNDKELLISMLKLWNEFV